jgi:hypothetical protein
MQAGSRKNKRQLFLKCCLTNMLTVADIFSDGIWCYAPAGPASQEAATGAEPHEFSLESCAAPQNIRVTRGKVAVCMVVIPRLCLIDGEPLATCASDQSRGRQP